MLKVKGAPPGVSVWGKLGGVGMVNTVPVVKDIELTVKLDPPELESETGIVFVSPTDTLPNEIGLGVTLSTPTSGASKV